MKIFCLSLLLLLLPACAAPWTKAVDTAMRDEMKQQELVGLAVGVIKNGRIEYLKGYGWADREMQTPVTRQTMFRWASISKSLTAVTALQPKTPNVWNVLRSAWMPAPPLLSLPAIVRATGGGLSMEVTHSSDFGC